MPIEKIQLLVVDENWQVKLKHICVKKINLFKHFCSETKNKNIFSPSREKSVSRPFCGSNFSFRGAL